MAFGSAIPVSAYQPVDIVMVTLTVRMPLMRVTVRQHSGPSLLQTHRTSTPPQATNPPDIQIQ